MNGGRKTVVFRIAKVRGADWQARLANAFSLNQERFLINRTSLSSIPDTRLTYWLTENQYRIFKNLPNTEESGLKTAVGIQTGNDERFVRLWFEVAPTDLYLSDGVNWRPFYKGGTNKKFWQDVFTVVRWEANGSTISNSKGSLIRNSDLLGKEGITWPLRTARFSPFPLTKDSIFSVRSYAVFSADSMTTLNIITSTAFDYFFRSILGRFGFPEYVTGTFVKVPFPQKSGKDTTKLLMATKEAARLAEGQEIGHAFFLPWLIRFRGATLSERFAAYQSFVGHTESELFRLQNEIDELAFDLYELSEEDRALIRSEMSGGAAQGAAETDADAEAEDTPEEADDDSDDEEEEAAGADLPTLSHALLSWCVGAAFGRWDVRMAQDASLIPELQGPFERLPVVAPAGLVGVDGYPAEGGQVAPMEWLKARPNVITLPEGEWQNTADYPLNVAWNGVLVSDVGGPNDLSTRVRAVLQQVFGQEAERIEEEALRAIQGDAKKTLTLEDYLRQPKHFFATHLKGYGRSRRKAPIYWPLMHKDAPEFVVWLYYPRMTAQTLPRVLTEVVLPRLDLARADVERLRGERAANDNARVASALEKAEDFAQGLSALAGEIRRLVDAGYTPEHDDGVIVTASPLHQIFPWKDLTAMFRNVQGGKYPWSHQHSIWASNEGAGQ